MKNLGKSSVGSDGSLRAKYCRVANVHPATFPAMQRWYGMHPSVTGVPKALRAPMDLDVSGFCRACLG